MPDMNQLLQALGMNQIQGNPSRGEAQYPNGWAGFAAGVGDWKNQEINKQQSRIQSTRQQLLGMINSIPDSEQNTPLKFKLAMDLMNAGDKHWSDKILAKNDFDNVISGMYKIFNQGMPESQPNTGIATTASGQTVAARPRIAMTDSTPGSGLANATAGDPTTGDVLSNVRPAPQPGKFDFSTTDDGKWQGINEVFQDEKTGDRYLMQYDRKSGQTRRINLGKAKTEGELTAAIKAQAKTTAKNAAVSRGYFERAVALSGIGSPDAFNELPLEIQNQYYAAAGQMKLEEDKLKSENTQSNIIKNKAIAGSAQAGIPLKKAQTANVLAQPKDPNAITVDEKRTLDTLLAPLEKEITRLQKIADNQSGTNTPSMVRQAKEQLKAKTAERDAIRNQVIRPAERLENTNTRRPSGGQTIPKGSSGPVGKTNDPLGIRQ